MAVVNGSSRCPSFRLRREAMQRGLQYAHMRRYGTGNGPKDAPNPHRAFYKSHGYPIFKVFLGALFTYQVCYWSWLKLESVEIQTRKNAEIQSLETKLQQLMGKE